MPKRSSFLSADSRQSSRTSQVRQTFLASLRGPTLLGEERLGVGLRAQRALLPARFLGVPVEEKEFSHGTRPFDPVLLTRPCDPTPYRDPTPESTNNTVGITCLSYPESQARIWYGCDQPTR